MPSVLDKGRSIEQAHFGGASLGHVNISTFKPAFRTMGNIAARPSPLGMEGLHHGLYLFPGARGEGHPTLDDLNMPFSTFARTSMEWILEQSSSYLQLDKTEVPARYAERWSTSLATGLAAFVTLAFFALLCVGAAIINMNIFHPWVFTGLLSSVLIPGVRWIST